MEPKQGSDMKPNLSELALEDFTMFVPDKDQKIGEIDGLFGDVYSGDHSFTFKNRDIMNGFLSSGGLTESLPWSQNLTPRQSSVSATMDSQSSICVGSPMSANKPKSKENQTRAATSGSSQEQSDDEDIEIEAGQCEQSTDYVKRIRRMVSNRESARRSRKRKQAHLVDLELQVEQLRREGSSLYKQLTDASQQYRDADTNNRVLKSDVEALRAKVKLAEDMVTRGSFTCNLNQLLQNHTLRQLANVSPTITVHGDDTSYGGMTVSRQNSALGFGNANISNGNLKNGIMSSDTLSCESEIWH